MTKLFETKKVAASGGAAVTTDAVDSTGCDFIVLSVSSYGGTDYTTVDSKSNTIIAGVDHNDGGNLHVKIFRIESVTGAGSGHTFTVDPAGQYRYMAITVEGFDDGPLTLDQETAVNTVSGSSALSTGSLTPSVDNCLLIAAFEADGASSISINGGFTAAASNSGGNNEANGMAYLIQTSATAANPAWTWTGSTGVAALAVFKPTGGGGSTEEGAAAASIGFSGAAVSAATAAASFAAVASFIGAAVPAAVAAGDALATFGFTNVARTPTLGTGGRLSRIGHLHRRRF